MAREQSISHFFQTLSIRLSTYGLRDPAYNGQKVEGIPHPAVYVIDKQGKVAWARIESDYKQRPTNEELRAALESLK